MRVTRSLVRHVFLKFQGGSDEAPIAWYDCGDVGPSRPGRSRVRPGRLDIHTRRRRRGHERRRHSGRRRGRQTQRDGPDDFRRHEQGGRFLFPGVEHRHVHGYGLTAGIQGGGHQRRCAEPQRDGLRALHAGRLDGERQQAVDHQRAAARHDQHHDGRRQHPGQHAAINRRFLCDRRAAARRDRGGDCPDGRPGCRFRRPGRRAGEVRHTLGDQHLYRQRLLLLPERLADREHLVQQPQRQSQACVAPETGRRSPRRSNPSRKGVLFRQLGGNARSERHVAAAHPAESAGAA